jgi:hypothetical protein
MTNEAYSRLIKALTDAGLNCYGQDPLVPFEVLVTPYDALLAHQVFKIRLDDPTEDCA